MKQGDERLFEQIYLAHFKTCVSYLTNQRRATLDDAHTSTMDALLEIRKELIQEKIQYGNLAFYFTYRAGKKLFKIHEKRKKLKQREPPENMDLQDDNDFLQTLQTKEMTQMVEQALLGLGQDCLRLLQLYYYENLNWSKIASIYYPEATEEIIKKRSGTLRRRTQRKCLPTFKSLLLKLLN